MRGKSSEDPVTVSSKHLTKWSFRATGQPLCLQSSTEPVRNSPFNLTKIHLLWWFLPEHFTEPQFPPVNVYF